MKIGPNRIRWGAAGAAAAAVLLVAGTLTGCGGPRTATANDTDVGVNVKTKTITIGATAAKTGPQAAFYESSQAAQAMVAQLNAHGGVNGWKLRYQVLDDGYQPDRAVAGVKKLVEEQNVFALVSMFGTPSNAATMPYVVSHRVPDVGFSMQTGIIANQYPDATNLFGYIPPYSDLAAFVARYVSQQAKLGSLALAYQDDDSGHSALAGLGHEAKQVGLSVPVTVPVATSATDFAGYAGRLAAAKAKAVLLWMPPAQAAGVMKASAAVGYQPQWIGSFFDPVPALFDAVGPLANGMRFESWLEPMDSGSAAMRGALATMSRYGSLHAPSVNAELGWLGMGLFVYGLQQATAHGRVPTRAALLAALNSGTTIHPAGLSVAVRYDSHSRVPTALDRIETWRDGHLTVAYGPVAGVSLPKDVVK